MRASDQTNLFAKQTLEEDDANRPNVHLRGNLGRFTARLEALRWKVPVGASTLGGQIHSRIRVIEVLSHQLTQAKVGNLYFARELT